MCGLAYYVATCLLLIALPARAGAQSPAPFPQRAGSVSTANVVHQDVLSVVLPEASTVALAQSPSLPGAVATHVAAGDLHTCALTTAGGVLCWGANYNGQLGNNSTTDSHVPVAVSGLASGVVAITAGLYHTCALTTAGAVLCWGYNDYGQLGDNTPGQADSHVPVAVSGLSSGVAAITAGAYHTCALTTAGGALCWGYNVYGELGNNSAPTTSFVPVGVSGLGSGVVAIAAGQFHTCVLTSAGAVLCWGYNQYGELGNNSTTNSPVPVAVSGLASGVAAITGGKYHACTLTMAGGTQCWGNNQYGQLGNNSTTDSPVPVAVTGLGSGVAAIAAGYQHTCVRTTAGGAQCWGLNNTGQLGNNSTTDSPVPVAVSNFTSDVAAIAAGGVHTCALTTTGAVKCWGWNAFGQLGDNSTTESHVPVAVIGLGNIVYANGFDN